MVITSDGQVLGGGGYEPSPMGLLLGLRAMQLLRQRERERQAEDEAADSSSEGQAAGPAAEKPSAEMVAFNYVGLAVCPL